jgi:hypothetical protein
MTMGVPQQFGFPKEREHAGTSNVSSACTASNCIR